uniref:Uncharacterized protein n=1 Tax=viral metagenome TaxID=1070528 RepID=A0A6C0JXR9_9ZZZZ
MDILLIDYKRDEVRLQIVHVSATAGRTYM